MKEILRLGEEVMTREQLEEAMDTSIKNITKKFSGRGGANYGFVVPKNTPRINEYDEDITFSVTFGDSRKISAVAMIPKFFNNEDRVPLAFMSTCLVFSNDKSRMQPLGGEDGVMTRRGYPKDTIFSAITVYGTIGRILLDYFRCTPEHLSQGLDFTTAHAGLVKPYIILSRESERKGNLIWINPTKFNGQSHLGCNLVRDTTLLRARDMISKKGTSEND